MDVNDLMEKYKDTAEEGVTVEKVEVKDPDVAPEEDVAEDTSKEEAPVDEKEGGSLKEMFGEDVSEEEVRSRYTGWTELNEKVATHEASLTKKEEELSAYRSFVENIGDPSKLYPREDIRHLANLVKKYPSLDGTVATKLASRKPDELSDVEALVIATALNEEVDGLRADEAEAIMFSRYGIESADEIEMLSDAKRKLMGVEIRKARALIARAQDDVKADETKRTPDDILASYKKSTEEQQIASRTAYEPVMDSLISEAEGDVEYNGRKLTTIKLSDEYKQELKEFMLGQVASRRMSLDDNSKQDVLRNINYKVWGDKRGEILSAMESDIRTNVTQEIEQKYVNHKPTDLQREARTETSDSGIGFLTEGLPKLGWGQ